MSKGALKFIILLVGILIGMLIGGGIAWYLFASEGKNIYIYNTTTKPEVTQPGSLNKENARIFKEKQDLTLHKKDSSFVETKTANTDLTEGSIKKSKELPDSTFNSIGELNNKSVEEEIVVKKDEIVSIKSVLLLDLVPNSEIANVRKDSVLQTLSGIKETAQGNWYVIEFWKSPINYKGYKTNKNKIVLFGLSDQEKIKLYKLEDLLLLKSGEKVYKIRKSPDFSAFEFINDPVLLSKLKHEKD